MPDYKKTIIERKQFLDRIAPMNFGQAFQYLLYFYGFETDDIEEGLEISRRTVERYLYSENRPEKHTLVRILVCVSDSYEVSETILHKAGFGLLGISWEDVAYRTILELNGLLSIDEANELICELNEGVEKQAEKIRLL